MKARHKRQRRAARLRRRSYVGEFRKAYVDSVLLGVGVVQFSARLGAQHIPAARLRYAGTDTGARWATVDT